MIDPIDDYCATIRADLAGLPGADDVVAELEDHLREATERLSGEDADQTAATELAIERLGEPELVARGIRTEHGWPRGSDPVAVRRLPFTMSEILLILAAVAYSLATFLFDSACGGDFDKLGEDTRQACLDRWEAVELLPSLPALPFGLDGLSTTPAIHGALLVSLILMATATLTFAMAQPWPGGTRRWALIAGGCTVAAGLAVATHPLDPGAGFSWWGAGAAIAIDAAALSAIALVWSGPLDVGRTPARPAQSPGDLVTSCTRYRIRASLILLAAAGAGAHVLQQVLLGPLAAIMIEASRSQLQWWLPAPWRNQIQPLLLLTLPIASMILGRRSRARTPADVTTAAQDTVPGGQVPPRPA
ncbi:MAG TPA: hypothetical protein PKA07_17230 [Micropruina sp.]|jgi:hypothetical protein|nr:hypothetical protein [Micropruina sp.]